MGCGMEGPPHSPPPPPLPPPPARLPCLQVLGTHNSYHQAPPQELLAKFGGLTSGPLQAWQYNQPGLTAQLDTGACRAAFPTVAVQPRCTALHRRLQGPGCPGLPACQTACPAPCPTAGVRSFELDGFWDPAGGVYAQAAGLRIAGQPGFLADPKYKQPGFKVCTAARLLACPRGAHRRQTAAPKHQAPCLPLPAPAMALAAAVHWARHPLLPRLAAGAACARL